MPSFFEDISSFYGTGERNPEGETLDEYLEKYDPYRYKGPFVTADIVVVRQTEEESNVGLELLMVQRKNHPCIGWWALPGGFAELHEDLMSSAKRELEEETGLTGIPMEQLYTWGEENRDPRCRIITVSYLAYLLNDVKVQAGDDAKDAAWVRIHLELQKTELISAENQWKRKREYYRLSLKNSSKGIHSEAIVAVEQNLNTILKELTFTVMENKEIAFDHARIITQALLYMNNH